MFSPRQFGRVSASGIGGRGFESGPHSEATPYQRCKNNTPFLNRHSVFRIRPCGTIFSNVDFSRCRLSASNVKFPQMYLRELVVVDTVKGLL